MKLRRMAIHMADGELLHLHDQVRAGKESYKTIGRQRGTTATDVRLAVRSALERRRIRRAEANGL